MTGSLPSSDNILAATTTDDRQEFEALYAIFKKFLQDYGNADNRQDLLEAMMDLRFEHIFKHALDGFGMNFESALELLRNKNDNLTKVQKDKRDILVAALDNLVDFAVAEEFQMTEELSGFDVDSDEWYDECDKVFERYNLHYAAVENNDVEYAMKIAAAWVYVSDNTYLTYMTQGDNRVRPWHMALEGTSYRKYEFPAWLIPPIEHGCRCFLVEDSGHILNTAKDVQAVISKPDFVNPVFVESVAKGGRIFGPAHSYFEIPSDQKAVLRQIAQKIKDKWLK